MSVRSFALSLIGLIPGVRVIASSVSNYPIPGVDFQYLRNCKSCGDYALQISRGGRNGVQHCGTCGHEEPMPDFDDDQVKSMVTSFWCHCQRYPSTPYNWHELSEDERWAILNRNK